MQTLQLFKTNLPTVALRSTTLADEDTASVQRSVRGAGIVLQFNPILILDLLDVSTPRSHSHEHSRSPHGASSSSNASDKLFSSGSGGGGGGGLGLRK
jgi:hypothetical protein